VRVVGRRASWTSSNRLLVFVQCRSHFALGFQARTFGVEGKSVFLGSDSGLRRAAGLALIHASHENEKIQERSDNLLRRCHTPKETDVIDYISQKRHESKTWPRLLVES
jgi:hypothetical protein